jgi:hypothetical protein
MKTQVLNPIIGILNLCANAKKQSVLNISAISKSNFSSEFKICWTSGSSNAFSQASALQALKKKALEIWSILIISWNDMMPTVSLIERVPRRSISL